MATKICVRKIIKIGEDFDPSRDEQRNVCNVFTIVLLAAGPGHILPGHVARYTDRFGCVLVSVTVGLQNSFQYSDWSSQCCLDRFDSSSDFQLFNFPYYDFVDHSGTPIIIGITVTIMINSFFVLPQSLSICLTLWLALCGRPEDKSQKFSMFSFFVVYYHYVRSSSWDYLFLSQNPKEFCVPHSSGRILVCENTIS